MYMYIYIVSSIHIFYTITLISQQFIYCSFSSFSSFSFPSF